MHVLVSASAHFAITNDGILWSPSTSPVYNLCTRYLDVYDEVRLLARAKLLSAPPSGWIKVSGSGIKPIAVPYFVGPWEFVKNYTAIRRVIGKALADAEAVQMRLPCSIGGEVFGLLASGRPYGVEIVADPYDSFAPGSVRHPLRPFFRWWFPRQLQQQCAGACAAAYVTEHALQHRYPPAPDAFSTHYSSIELPDSALLAAPRRFNREVRTFTLITVATLAQMYKAPDVLIDAVALCVREGLDIKLILVGDGKHRAELEARAALLGLEDRVRFLGQLPAGEAVRSQLDQSDLFVLPSRQEGLPRAMIEAMARGLPCIGSTVGGIPELLLPEDIVPPGDVTALAHKIREVVTNSERMARISVRNLEKAREYLDEALRERRIVFYRYVKERTIAWLKAQKH